MDATIESGRAEAECSSEAAEIKPERCLLIQIEISTYVRSPALSRESCSFQVIPLHFHCTTSSKFAAVRCSSRKGLTKSDMCVDGHPRCDS